MEHLTGTSFAQTLGQCSKQMVTHVRWAQSNELSRAVCLKLRPVESAIISFPLFCTVREVTTRVPLNGVEADVYPVVDTGGVPMLDEDMPVRKTDCTCSS